MIENKEELAVLNTLISIRSYRNFSITGINEVLELLDHNWISVDNEEFFRQTCEKFIKYLNTI